MWDKVVEYFLSQGMLGIAILCMGAVLILFYKEAAKERKENKTENREYTDKFITIATESVKYIQENTSTLRDMRDEMKQHNIEAQEHRRNNENSTEKLLLLLDTELKLRGK